jgi:predicted O-methyltransferase YrrM
VAVTTKREKLICLASLVLEKPGEFMDRFGAIAQVAFDNLRSSPAYFPESEESAFAAFENIFGGRVRESLQDVGLTKIDAQVAKKSAGIDSEGPFHGEHSGDRLLARVCYTLVRALQPRTVVETGVCYGVTSSYLLQALKENDSGVLHSIDLPPLSENGDDYVGWLVPSPLRDRWTLHRGTSRRLLLPLLREWRPLDLFVHDSLHTYGNMKMEFEAAWSALRPSGVLISDDIEGNRAFLELAQRGDVALSVVVQEVNKKALLGVAVKRE